MNKEEELIKKILSGVYQHLGMIVPLTIKKAVEEAFHERAKDQPVEYDENLDSKQAASFLKIKISTLYSKIGKGELSYSRAGKRKLLFKKEELEKFLLKRKVESNDEINTEVENYISFKR